MTNILIITLAAFSAAATISGIFNSGAAIYAARAFNHLAKSFGFLSDRVTLMRSDMDSLRTFLAPQEIECTHCGQRTTGVQRATLRPDWTVSDDHGGPVAQAIPGHQLIEGQLGFAAACTCTWVSDPGNPAPGRFQYAQHMTEMSSS